MRLALDCSNYTPAPSPAQLACLKGAGYERAIIGCSFGSVADMQIAAYYSSGFEVEAYAWVAFGSNWQTALDRALFVISHRPYVTRLWLDCEEQVTGMTPAEYEARINAAVDYVRGKRPDLALGIYTGGWWWKPNTNDSHGFCDLALFTAEYVADASQPPGGMPALFGGWGAAAMWQYAGSTLTCGLNLDLSVILEDDMPLSDADIAKIVDASKLGAVQAAQQGLTDQQKTDAANVAKLELEAFRQELEAAGQLPPRKVG